MDRMRPLESLPVKFLDEPWKRDFPGLLLVIVELPELLRVHPEFSCHLNLFICKEMTPFCPDPRNHLSRNFLLAHDTPRAGLERLMSDGNGVPSSSSAFARPPKVIGLLESPK